MIIMYEHLTHILLHEKENIIEYISENFYVQKIANIPLYYVLNNCFNDIIQKILDEETRLVIGPIGYVSMSDMDILEDYLIERHMLENMCVKPDNKMIHEAEILVAEEIKTIIEGVNYAC